jgi:hypothetical protein
MVVVVVFALPMQSLKRFEILRSPAIEEQHTLCTLMTLNDTTLYLFLQKP